jgi:hypothetical protein
LRRKDNTANPTLAFGGNGGGTGLRSISGGDGRLEDGGEGRLRFSGGGGVALGGGGGFLFLCGGGSLFSWEAAAAAPVSLSSATPSATVESAATASATTGDDSVARLGPGDSTGSPATAAAVDDVKESSQPLMAKAFSSSSGSRLRRRYGREVQQAAIPIYALHSGNNNQCTTFVSAHCQLHPTAKIWHDCVTSTRHGHMYGHMYGYA